MKPTPVIPHGPTNVYEPAEDSFFLLDCLENEAEFLASLKCPLVAEIGTGSGIVSAFMPQLITKYVPLAADVSISALELANQTWNTNIHNNLLETCCGDLLTYIRPQTVDVLLCNPPYVPSETVPAPPEQDSSDKWVDLALDGGLNGMEVTNRILDGLDSWLAPTGVAYILFCASNQPEAIAKSMDERGWQVKQVGKRRAGWEILSVYKFSRKGR